MEAQTPAAAPAAPRRREHVFGRALFPTTCDAECCWRLPLVNGLCEYHLEEGGWDTVVLSVPERIAAAMAEQILESAAQSLLEGALLREYEELAARLKSLPPWAFRDGVAFNLAELNIFEHEIYRYADGGTYDQEWYDYQLGRSLRAFGFRIPGATQRLKKKIEKRRKAQGEGS